MSSVASSAYRPGAGVAMCIYNGGRFLRQQLDSIASQTELPERLVVFDDGSTDGSWELLQAWVPTAPFTVDIHRNESRVGVVRNFERATTLVEQEIIFLADQDDLWYPDKVRTFIDEFVRKPDLGLVHSDADLIDGEGQPLGRRLLATLLVTPHERGLIAADQAYRVYAKRNLVTGAACAVRREVLRRSVPFSPRWVHDEWLAFIAGLVSRVGLIDSPTMAYRLHGGNTVGLPVPTLAWRLRTTWRAFAQATVRGQRERAEKLDDVLAIARALGAAQEAIDFIQAASEHARFRANLPSNPGVRLVRILRERRAGHYHAWSNGPVSMLHDLLIAR